MSEPILLYRAVDPNEGALIVQVLDADQIPNSHTNGMSTIGFGELPADARQIDIWIPREHAARARKLIEDYQALSDPSRSDREPWACAACGESNHDSFQICWNCQEARATTPS